MPWLIDTIDRVMSKGETSSSTVSDTTTLVRTGTVATARTGTVTLAKTGTTTIVDAAVEETNSGSDDTTQTVNEDQGMHCRFSITVKGGLLGPDTPPPPLCA